MRSAVPTLAAMLIPVAAFAASIAPPASTQPAADYSSEWSRSNAYAGPRTEQNLDRISKALAVPATRLAAVRELIDFAGFSAYEIPSVIAGYDDHSGAIRRRAAKLAHAAADNDTVLQALTGNDPILKFWGIWHFRDLKKPRASLPILEKIAQGGDEALRGRAVERLQGYPGEQQFVRNLAATEKSPGVLEEILFPDNPTGIPAFNKHLRALLRDGDPAVRKEVINFIAVNHFNASCRQTFIDGSLMDGLLACAQAKSPGASAALAAFKDYANTDFPDAPAAAAWWKSHRSDWELARFPRGAQPNGGMIFPFITTTGQVDGNPAWHASITLKNMGKESVCINLAEISTMNWSLYDANGQRIPVNDEHDRSAPEWHTLKPGESITRAAPIDPDLADPSLAPGKYTLQACLELGTDARGIPPGVPLESGELPLPAISVEVAAPK